MEQELHDNYFKYRKIMSKGPVIIQSKYSQKESIHWTPEFSSRASFKWSYL